MSYTGLALNLGLQKGLTALGVSHFGWPSLRHLFGLLWVILLFSLLFSGSASANYQQFGQKTSNPQKVVLSLTQSGVNPPVITVLKNDFTGVTFTGFYNGIGDYLILASAPIFNGGTQKTAVMTATVNPVYWSNTPVYVWGGVADGVTTNALHVVTGQDSGGFYTPKDGLLSQHVLEVTVYP